MKKLILIALISILGIFIALTIFSNLEDKNLPQEEMEELELSNQELRKEILGAVNNEKRIEKLKIDQKAQIENLLKQSIIVSSNDQMHLHKTYEISCIITGFNNKNKIQEEVVKNKRSIILDDSISTSNVMSMTLVGVNFKIEELNERKQALNFIDNQTEWKWKVEPLKSGQQTLEIEGYAYIDIEGESTPIKINVYKEDIEVRIGFFNAFQMIIKKNWEWVFGIIPFFWFLHNRYKKRNKENVSHPKP